MLSAGIIYRPAMLKPTDGFDILVNGSTPRTFRDREEMAIAAARQLAGKRGNDPVNVRSRATGEMRTVGADGSVRPAKA